MGAGTIMQDQKYSGEIPIQWQIKFLIPPQELRPAKPQAARTYPVSF